MKLLLTHLCYINYKLVETYMLHGTFDSFSFENYGIGFPTLLYLEDLILKKRSEDSYILYLEDF